MFCLLQISGSLINLGFSLYSSQFIYIYFWGFFVFLSVLPTAQVKEGEVVLVHAAASGVGTAAIQLARLLGAVPIVTAGSPEKLRMAEKLGAGAGFNYREENFVSGVLDFTGGEGLYIFLASII